jgi:hypothetical protein
MSTNLTAFAGANLPSVQSLSDSLRSIQTDVAPGGSIILKMDRTGHWVFGTDQTEVEDDARWAVNPFSFVHGFIAWGNGEVLGEKMVNIAQPLPELEEAPAGAPKGWEKQVGLSLKCISGEDKGIDVRYSATSVGGKRAVQELAVAIAGQVDKDPTRPVPVIELRKEQYQHKQYGKIFSPVFKIVDWVSMEGEAAPQAVEDAVWDEAPADEAPRRRRRVA